MSNCPNFIEIRGMTVYKEKGAQGFYKGSSRLATVRQIIAENGRADQFQGHKSTDEQQLGIYEAETLGYWIAPMCYLS